MSFSKAKIHRFNDETPCAPSPGAYNPVPVDKTVGPIINKTERFSINRKMIHASSTESLNSLHSEKGISNTEIFATFKTPRIPSTYRSICHTDIRRNMRAVSIDYLNKKSSNDDYEINSLRYSLNMIQEELTMEKNRNQQLINDLEQHKQTDSDTNWYTEWLFDVIVEKENCINLLSEKCKTLQSFANEYFDSYRQFMDEKYSILEKHLQLLAQNDSSFNGVVKHYEKLIFERDSSLETAISMFDTLQQLNCINIDRTQLEKLTAQHNDLIKKLEETEKNRRIYEFRLQRQQEVIDILRNRVNESDETANSLLKVVQGFAKSEGTADFIEYTQKTLLKRVDEFKDQAISEKKNYERSVQEKDALFVNLKSEKDNIELQLQESLDQIEILKCKEQVLQNEFSERINQFQKTLHDYQERLLQWEKSNGSSETTEHSELVENLLEFATQSGESVFTNDRKLAVEKFSTQFSYMLNSSLSDQNTNKIEFLQRFLVCVMHTFAKVSNEISALKTDLARVRADFIEKCDECGQITRLLQLSEKHVEDLEKKISELEFCQNEYEAKAAEQAKQFSQLQMEKVDLRFSMLQNKENESEREEPITKESEVSKVELKQAMLKIETIEKEKQELLERIAVLEKLEAENKQLKKNDTKMLLKSQMMKSKQIMKPRNEISIVKKKLEMLAPKSLVKTAGKENKLIVKAKAASEMRKTAPVEVPGVNATYIVTSPKINRI